MHLHRARVATCICPHLGRQHLRPVAQLVLRQLHAPQRLLQVAHARAQAPRYHLADAVAVAMDHIACRAAAVLAVEGSGALQAHGRVARLAEEPQLLSWVKGAKDWPRQATLGLQLFQALDGVR